MGIDYTSSAAYGLILPDQERVIDLAIDLGYDLGEWGRDGIDYFDLVDFVAKQFELEVYEAGDSYSGEIDFLIGKGVTHWQFGWTKVEPQPVITTAQYEQLQNLRVALGIEDEPAWYAGLHIW